MASLLRPEALALYGCARSLIDWHKRHCFCANCGKATHTIKAGWARKCSGCEAEHFPRVDPVGIMLAEYDGKILVGGPQRFPAVRYSARSDERRVGTRCVSAGRQRWSTER